METTSPSTAASSTASEADSASTATSTASDQSTQVSVQEETVRVMPNMTFVIAATKNGTTIKTSKNKKNFTYKTSNKKIAKVTTKGVVTTKKKGKCDITVTCKSDGSQYILHLNVAKTVKVTKVKLDTKKKTFEESKKNKFTIEATVKPSKYADVPVKWYSPNKNIATVDDRGNVTTKGYGSCKIVCVAGSNNKSAYCSVTVVNPDAEEGPDTGTSGETGKVVDISQFNTVNDWKKLKESCDAVIIRVGGRYYGSGALYEDEKFRSNVYNCQQYGIPFSFYFYTNAVTAAEGVEEARFISARVGSYSRALPVFVDSEISPSKTGRADGLSQSERTTAVKAECQQLSSSGITPGVYGSTNYLKVKLNMSDLPYAVWVAQYGQSCTYDGSKMLWQFTSSATGYGINNGCDVSYWYK